MKAVTQMSTAACAWGGHASSGGPWPRLKQDLSPRGAQTSGSVRDRRDPSSQRSGLCHCQSGGSSGARVTSTAFTRAAANGCRRSDGGPRSQLRSASPDRFEQPQRSQRWQRECVGEVADGRREARGTPDAEPTSGRATPSAFMPASNSGGPCRNSVSTSRCWALGVAGGLCEHR